MTDPLPFLPHPVGQLRLKFRIPMVTTGSSSADHRGVRAIRRAALPHHPSVRRRSDDGQQGQQAGVWARNGIPSLLHLRTGVRNATALHLVDRTSEAVIPGQRLEQAGRLELVRIVNDRPPSWFVLIRNFNQSDNGPDRVRYMSPNGPPSPFRVIGILTK